MKKRKSNRIKRAITHIKLDLANQWKLDRLESLSGVYMGLTQEFVDHIFNNNLLDVDRYDPLPDIPSVLSERYMRCAWQQAAGIMKSFFSNERTNKPVLKRVAIQGNTNVIKLEKSDSDEFDFWLKVSTLEKRKPVLLPVKMHKYGKSVLKTGKLCTGVTLSLENGKWYATFVVEKKNKKEKAKKKLVGVDIGIKNLLTTTEGHFGQFSERLIDSVKKSDEKISRKQKLNSCLKKKGLEPVSLQNNKIQATTKNEIGRAINQFIGSLPEKPTVVLEKLSASGMRFKSRRMNRILKASKIGYACDRLKEKLDLNHIRYRSVNAAYTSQECSDCGYVDKANRLNQETFVCKFCEHTENADVNASKTIPKRFGDSELNGVEDFRDVKSILLERFFKRFPDARSASGGLELGCTLREIGGIPPIVNQSALT